MTEFLVVSLAFGAHFVTELLSGSDLMSKMHLLLTHTRFIDNVEG
jgi:hypothetical protein